MAQYHGGCRQEFINHFNGSANSALPKREFLRQRYFEKRLSTRQIAVEIRSARSTVKEALRQFKIPMRPEDVARKLSKGQLSYGEKLINEIIPHARELRVIAKMIDLRSSGASYREIALWLNLRAIQTKNSVKN